MDQPAGCPHRPGVDGHRVDGPLGAAPGQRLDPQRVQLVARRRHQLLLGALAADEGDLGALGPQRVGHRQRGHDVPGGATGADHDPRHPRDLESCAPGRIRARRSRCTRSDRRMPIANARATKIR